MPLKVLNCVLIDKKNLLVLLFWASQDALSHQFFVQIINTFLQVWKFQSFRWSWNVKSAAMLVNLKHLKHISVPHDSSFKQDTSPALPAGLVKKLSPCCLIGDMVLSRCRGSHDGLGWMGLTSEACHCGRPLRNRFLEPKAASKKNHQLCTLQSEEGRPQRNHAQRKHPKALGTSLF